MSTVVAEFEHNTVFESARPFVDQGVLERLHLAVDVVWSQVQSYARQTFLKVTDDVATVQGVYCSRLVVGEAPITAVDSVELDGNMLNVDDYRWSRRGFLTRLAGWGGPAAEIVVTYDHGYDELPMSVFFVCVTAAARLANNPEELVREETEGYSSVSETASGFTLSERAVLDRYRRRTFTA